MFLAALLNFIVSFCFTLGLMQLLATVLALLNYKEMKEHIPKWPILLSHNALSAFLIAIAFTITTNYLPILYKQVSVNDGLLNLYSKELNWSHMVVIKAEPHQVSFTACAKEYTTPNNMYDFYESLNQALVECSLPKDSAINIEIVKNPFKHLNKSISNSLIRKHFMSDM